jgi:hypothetical protein
MGKLMVFDDLSDTQLDLITKLAQKLTTGKYKPEFRVLTQLMSAGPEIHLVCTETEAVEPPIKHFRESTLDTLSEKGYITLVPEGQPGSHRLMGSLTDKTYQQYDLYTRSPYNLAKLVQDEELAKILSQRWEESFHTFEAKSYLSTIILLGSFLEGVLLDKVQSNKKQANQAKSAPKAEDKTRPFNEWTLNDLIKVAYECRWLDKDVKVFSEALRDYRNLVHPREQLRHQTYPDEGTCRVAREVVEAALEDLSKVIK